MVTEKLGRIPFDCKTMAALRGSAQLPMPKGPKSLNLLDAPL